MWRFVLAVSLLCCSSDASLTCKDENGGQVDWFILYKAPKQKDKLTGLEYIYIGPDAHGKVTKRTGTDIKGILANTLRPILKSVREMPEDFGFISYSDQPPGCSADNQKFGHSKGVVMVDKTTAVWLLHSTPQFPFRRDQNKFWPPSGAKNAQTFICVKFPSEPAYIEHIGKHLQSIRAFPFDHYIPDGFYKELKELKDVVNWNKLDPPGVLQLLIKKGDVTFYSIAKKQAVKEKGKPGSGQDSDKMEVEESDEPMVDCSKDGSPMEIDEDPAGGDLYVGDLYVSIAKEVKSHVNVQTWHSDTEGDISYCKGPENVYNIKSVQIKDLGEWSPGNDHSKWCVDENKLWTCIADVNRAKTQFLRYGGALCIKDKNIAEIFMSFKKETESCKDAEERKKKKKQKVKKKLPPL
ncbi:deoxyribonuclease-2-beta [Lates calcarifer]|uniref:Deoxyribonuclease-2-alpha n=1 Tax=Lates calcarifer TaxID=8187 RepID=A0AAJ7Q2X1_LATCA|nr:deoxyribonuclease-2-beta [Lates calcarifer]